ncbi:MAG: hypothetical protein J6W60_15215 [Treponema sp.]|nr:hypothetical protein [Treponema sp.]MBP5754189.1 hypothetical protein [Treponema sp.]
MNFQIKSDKKRVRQSLKYDIQFSYFSVKALDALGANTKASEKLSRLVTSDSDWLEVDFAPWSPEGSELYDKT